MAQTDSGRTLTNEKTAGSGDTISHSKIPRTLVHTRFFRAASERFGLEWWGFLVILVVLVLIGFRVYVRGRQQANSGLLGRPLRVGIVPWPGYAGGLMANHGLKPNKDSIFWKEQNLFVEFKVINSDTQLRRDFVLGGENGGIDVMWSTVDSLAQQAPTFSKQGIRPQAFVQVDWSRGGDAIIARAGIDRIEDLKFLKERRVAVSMAASQYLFEYSLDYSSLKDEDKTRIRQNVRRLTNGSAEALDLFIKNEVDVAVLWEPDVTTALNQRPGSHLLISTEQAPYLIADVMVAKDEFIRKYPNVIKAFINGWREGATTAIRDPMLAVKVFMDEPDLGFETLGETKIRELLGKTAITTLDDNVEMFGLSDNEAYFDRLFKHASKVWLSAGYITEPTSAEGARDIRFLKEIYDLERESMVRSGCDQTLPTVEVPIIFAPNKADLSLQAQEALDHQDIALLLRTNSEFRFCVEATVTDLDDPRLAPITKRSREDAVIKYLIEQFKRPATQFKSSNESTYPTRADWKPTKYMRLKIVSESQ